MTGQVPLWAVWAMVAFSVGMMLCLLVAAHARREARVNLENRQIALRSARQAERECEAMRQVAWQAVDRLVGYREKNLHILANLGLRFGTERVTFLADPRRPRHPVKGWADELGPVFEDSLPMKLRHIELGGSPWEVSVQMRLDVSPPTDNSYNEAVLQEVLHQAINLLETAMRKHWTDHGLLPPKATNTDEPDRRYTGVRDLLRALHG